MRVIENECVGCRDMGLPCRGSMCPNRHVVRFYCDNCDCEIDPGFTCDEPEEFDGKHYCNECLLELGYMDAENDEED